MKMVYYITKIEEYFLDLTFDIWYCFCVLIVMTFLYTSAIEQKTIKEDEEEGTMKLYAYYYYSIWVQLFVWVDLYASLTFEKLFPVWSEQIFLCSSTIDYCTVPYHYKTFSESTSHFLCHTQWERKVRELKVDTRELVFCEKCLGLIN